MTIYKILKLEKLEIKKIYSQHWILLVKTMFASILDKKKEVKMQFNHIFRARNAKSIERVIDLLINWNQIR